MRPAVKPRGSRVRTSIARLRLAMAMVLSVFVVGVIGYAAFGLTVALGLASTAYTVAFLSLAIGLGVGVSFIAVALEELGFRRYPRWRDLWQLIMLAVVENFGYRQLTMISRVRGTISALRKRKGWGHMERRGFGPGPGPRQDQPGRTRP